MRAAVFHAPGDIRVEQVPDASIQASTDAVVRITHACICGSDLHFWRGDQPYEDGWRCGHELMGVVEDVGSDVRSVRRGDHVVAPFAISDGTCEFCRAGLQTSCVHVDFWARMQDGGQGEAVRAPFADGTLVKVPPEVASDEALARRILPLSDVMGTGHHVVVSSGLVRGGTIAIVGDGAVGLSAVIAARRLGADRVVVITHPGELHEQRGALARRLGATDVVAASDDDVVERVNDLVPAGVPHVAECVGGNTSASINAALRIARPGGTVGYVGVPVNDGTVDRFAMFGANITLAGGAAPVRAYLPELLGDVLAGNLDPSPVLDTVLPLTSVADGYRAMDQRQAIKVLLLPASAGPV